MDAFTYCWGDHGNMIGMLTTMDRRIPTTSWTEEYQTLLAKREFFKDMLDTGQMRIPFGFITYFNLVSF